MNKQPVSYLQTDKRWKDKRYPCNGGTMSIGGGGCGPTSCAMLIETLTGKPCPPTEAMDWICKHGYMYANQGTSYDAFRPIFSAYGIEADMLTWTQCMSADSPLRLKVRSMLMDGYYFIALMKKGLWTKGGHYVVVWWADDKIRINDPASTRDERLNGDPAAFWSTAKYFWWVDARHHNLRNDSDKNKKKKEEGINMTKAEFLASLTDEEALDILTRAERAAGKKPVSEYARSACQRGIESGLFTDGDRDGMLDRPQAFVKRQELAVVLDRKGLLDV